MKKIEYFFSKTLNFLHDIDLVSYLAFLIFFIIFFYFTKRIFFTETNKLKYENLKITAIVLFVEFPILFLILLFILYLTLKDQPF